MQHDSSYCRQKLLVENCCFLNPLFGFKSFLYADIIYWTAQSLEHESLQSEFIDTSSICKIQIHRVTPICHTSANTQKFSRKKQDL